MKQNEVKKFSSVLLCLVAGVSMALPTVKFKVDAKEAESKTVNPIAKYEFKDASNPGLDSMGNYNLSLKNADGCATGTVSVADGIALFDGTAGLISPNEENDITESLTSFSLSYDLKMTKTSGWSEPLSFGWNDWSATKWMTFEFSDSSDVLRFGGQGLDASPNPYWLPEIGALGEEEFHNVLLTVEQGGKAKVYLDGVEKYAYDVPADYSLSDGNMRFSLGGSNCWGNIYTPFKGSIKNVEIYDFAFNDLQTIAYNVNKKITEADIAQQEVVAPTAKYDFTDSDNPGADAMGNYDLVVKNADGFATGAVSVEDGVALFDGTAGLISPNEAGDITESLTSFSVAYDLKMTKTNGWSEPLSFGWNDWSATKWMTFEFSDSSDVLRFGGQGLDASPNPYWLPEIGALGEEEFHSVLLTVEQGGKAVVYLDGVEKYAYDVPADYSLSDGNMRFSLGGSNCWGNIYTPFKGSIKNVEIYDTAMSTTQAMQYNATGKLYRALDVKVASANIDLSSSIIADAADSNEQILLYAPNESKVDVTMSNDSVESALVKWTDVTTIDGEKYLVGKIQGLVNPDDIKAYAKISVVEGSKELLPIAKYEFKDPANPGKDSMGNYNLVVTNKDNENPGTIVCENGVARFDGTAALMAGDEGNDITEALESYTLAFDVKKIGTNDGWTEPIGFGWNDWNATKWGGFMYSGDTNLRFSTASGINEETGYGNVDGATTNQFWGPVVADTEANTASVVLSLDVNGLVCVYVNGVAKYSYTVPEGYSLKDGSMQFGIGANCTWGAGRDFFNGEISNVSIYDFAVTAAQAKVLGAAKEIKTNVLLGTNYITDIDTTVTFADANVTSGTLYSNMSEEEMLALVNKATVNATLSDDTNKVLDVNWTKVVKENDTYKAVGVVSAQQLGVPTVVASKEVEQVLTVETKTYTATVEAGVNGTVSVGANNEFEEGATVTVVVTPDNGYKVVCVMVDDVEVTPVDGAYTFVITKDVTVKANFEKEDEESTEPSSSEQPSVEPSEEPSQEPSAAESETPSVSEKESTPAVSENVSETTSEDNKPAPKKGCKGSAGGSLIGLISLFGLVIFKKRK